MARSPERKRPRGSSKTSEPCSESRRWKIAPGLLAGNTLVTKPSPFTPLSTLMLGEILRDVLPPGVVNVISGGDSLGAWMTAHPVPRKISFTGSVETGKKVAASAAPDLKRLTLELGGNDAAIVLDDVKLDAVAEKLFWGAFQNCGQVCSAIKRVYVPEKLASVDRLAALARGVKVGDGFQEGVQLGPLNNRPQFERAKGAGGGRPEGRRAHRRGRSPRREGLRLPAHDRGGRRGGRAARGRGAVRPRAGGDRLRNLDDAVERANRTSFGLSGSVWSQDPERAAAVAGRLECGTAWVNQHLAIVPFAPFGGAKWSGIGVENGKWGLLGFTEIQTVNVAKKPAGS
jgi:acyl-CoA reductase-like NAD-dependent aldehyde dehydrogenase